MLRPPFEPYSKVRNTKLYGKPDMKPTDTRHHNRTLANLIQKISNPIEPRRMATCSPIATFLKNARYSRFFLIP